MDKIMDTALTELVVRTCLAVRQSLAQEAAVGFGELVAAKKSTRDHACWLGAVETCLVTAARSKQAELVQGWLRAVSPMLVGSKQQPTAELVAARGELLLKLCFAACDKRLEALFPLLQGQWRSWLDAVEQVQELQRLCGELLNLAARMARRGWRQEARFVLRLVARAALKGGRLKQEVRLPLWRSILARLSLHFTVYARWDGFAKACEAYEELVSLLLLLVRRSGCKGLPLAVRTASLQLALRTVRDLVTNNARSTMQEDMDIFRQWYQFLWQLAGENQARKQKLLLLLQLSIRYWQLTLPKSSRKQLRFLQDLLQPNLINAEYEELLQRIA
ncbi:MAG: hypothetical protein ACI3WU_04525 [Phascolarctobacterium sp.]